MRSSASGLRPVYRTICVRRAAKFRHLDSTNIRRSASLSLLGADTFCLVGMAGYRRPRTPGSRSATSRKPRPTPTRAPPCATTGHGPAWTGTPPLSSPPTSPEPPGRQYQPLRLAWPPQGGQAKPHLRNAVTVGYQLNAREPPLCGPVAGGWLINGGVRNG
jgi:hypothetical protein